MMRVSRPRIVLVGLAVVTGLLLTREGWVRAMESRAGADAARREMDAAEGERGRVAKRIADAESPVGQEESARERGYRRPDERPVEAQ